MKKTNQQNGTLKVVVVNPPTKEQVQKRIKELSSYLEKNWKI